MSPQAASTLLARFAEQVRLRPDEPALLAKRGGQFAAQSWRQLGDEVTATAAALRRLGVRAGDRVATVAENSVEWVLLDLAAACLHAVHVPLHTALSPEQTAEQIRQVQATLVLVGGETQAEKLARTELIPAASIQRLERLAEVATATNCSVMPSLEAAAAEVPPNSLATILFTSGTIGRAKGVMLTHGNLAANAASTAAASGESADDLKLGMLPLCHSFARTCDLGTWLTLGNRLALAESRESIAADCLAVRPTWINSVPAFYDRLRRGLLASGRADEHDALRAALGGRIRSCQCGGAPLADELFDFFWQRGVPLFAGYGLTEASPVISVSHPAAWRRGSVGRPIGGVQLRIDADGEVLVRGPNVMSGYWQDSPATDAVLRDGWLHTGDLGRLDDDGFLFLTGRKKELIVLANGYKVSPAAIEGRLLADPLIEQVVVVGTGRDHLAALIVPCEPALRAVLREPDMRIVTCDAVVQPLSELATDPRVRGLFELRIALRLANLSRYEQVRHLALLDRPLSIADGHLTAKQSLRRAAIEAAFADRIAAMYDSAEVEFVGFSGLSPPTV